MQIFKYIVSIIVAFVPLAGVVAQNSPDPIYIADELFVKLKVEEYSSQDAFQYFPNPNRYEPGKATWKTIQEFGGESMTKTFPESIESMRYVYRVKLKDGSDINALVAALSAESEVASVSLIPIYYTQKQPFELDESKQWYFKNINMKTSWSATQGLEKNIAIIDNGVRYTHEDLRSKLMMTAEIENNKVDDDNNGYIDDYYGWDVADKDADPSPRSRPNPAGPGIGPLYACHGTHVAGIVAAADNNIGIASLGISNKILCIKAHRSANNDDRSLTNVHEAIAYAIHKRVDIINCSFSTEVFDANLEALIAEAIDKGIIVVAAAGNLKSDGLMYPAAYDGVIAVGATDKANIKAAYSNYGSYIDVMAPGDDILSTIATGDNQYAVMSGTSMAAPIVSSLIGLILSKEPDRVGQIEDILKRGCEDITAQNPSLSGRLGAGLINVDKTFEMMLYSLSVGEHPITKDFAVYPNPSSSDVFIPYQTLAPDGGVLVINVYNTAGVLVSKVDISDANQAVSVSALATGIYTLSATNNNGQYYSSRLLVQH